jgi:hypothetical protein
LVGAAGGEAEGGCRGSGEVGHVVLLFVALGLDLATAVISHWIVSYTTLELKLPFFMSLERNAWRRYAARSPFPLLSLA